MIQGIECKSKPHSDRSTLLQAIWPAAPRLQQAAPVRPSDTAVREPLFGHTPGSALPHRIGFSQRLQEASAALAAPIMRETTAAGGGGRNIAANPAVLVVDEVGGQVRSGRVVDPSSGIGVKEGSQVVVSAAEASTTVISSVLSAVMSGITAVGRALMPLPLRKVLDGAFIRQARPLSVATITQYTVFPRQREPSHSLLPLTE